MVKYDKNIGCVLMNIDDFEYLMNSCTISLDENNSVHFAPLSYKAGKIVAKIIHDNALENLSLQGLQKIADEFKPQLLTRNKIKQVKAKEFALLSPDKVAGLALEKKLEYMEILFPLNQTVNELKTVCKENYENIRACLFNIKFPANFWDKEKKSAERYAALISNQPELTDKLKNWEHTSLDEKKDAVIQAGKVFEYVYGIKPEIVFTSTEEERAKNVAQGLSADAHINAAYQRGGKIYFNTDRLQESDNFFAVSVLFHEGTHLRQHFQTFEDAAVERIFNCNLVNASLYEDLADDKTAAEYKDLYVMQPSEVHACGLQEYVEQRLTEKTGINKVHYKNPDKDVQKVHNKLFSMEKVSQYKSSQKN